MKTMENDVFPLLVESGEGKAGSEGEGRNGKVEKEGMGEGRPGERRKNEWG
jgi:hypothetical protein